MTGPTTDIKTTSTRALQQRKKRLLERMPDLGSVISGSLIERYKRCGKPGCKCAKGRGHGPKYYLSVSRSGTTPRMDYVPNEYQPQVLEYVENNRQVRGILKRICAINHELLRRRQRL